MLEPQELALTRARPRTSPEPALLRAILSTVIYADLFEYPLKRSELHRYLIGEAASEPAVGSALADAAHRGLLERTGDFIHLPGRSRLAAVRRQRGEVSARLWPVAHRYGRMIARLPCVRLVSVTGALAMNNAGSDDDIDLFILVQPGRLWLCRLLVLGIVKLAARHGYVLCPNFLLSTDHLPLSERTLFTAHEVLQMVPLEPGPSYRAFLEANGWVRDFLPNALGEREPVAPPASPRRLLAGGATRVLSTRLFDPVERWEMRRKVRRLTARLQREGGSVAFSAHECRGHFSGHDARVLAAYRDGVAKYADALP